MSENSNWTIRPAHGEDLHFIYSTWLNNVWASSEHDIACSKHFFFTSYSKVIDEILNDKATLVSVACAPDDASVIYGYCVSHNKTIHFIFVKSIFRRCGIATALCERIEFDGSMTHLSKMLRGFNQFLDYKPELLPDILISGKTFFKIGVTDGKEKH